MRYGTALAAGLGLALLAACSQAPAASNQGAEGDTPPVATGATLSGAAFCAKLQPMIQPQVKPALVLFQASDATTDPNHAGETPYLDCDFRQAGGQIDVGLHDDGDGRFDNAAQQGYAALPGFGDHARYLTQPAAGMRWVDVVRGKVACEARFNIADDALSGDWKTVAGQMCETALRAGAG
jgi:hypothetical protein